MTESSPSQNPCKGRLHHLAIQTRNWEESKRFYIDILGMKQVGGFRLPQREVLFLDLGGGDLVELFAPVKDPDYQLPDYENGSLALFHFALKVDDVEGATERCRAAGYSVKVEPKIFKTEGIHAHLAFIIGPNGEHVEFFKPLD
ncbi:MAG: VOC family protein [Verrucomicrobiae bacterium]|nr:VOC family protein [Verrucomicrobiae bacterium]